MKIMMYLMPIMYKSNKSAQHLTSYIKPLLSNLQDLINLYFINHIYKQHKMDLNYNHSLSDLILKKLIKIKKINYELKINIKQYESTLFNLTFHKQCNLFLTPILENRKKLNNFVKKYNLSLNPSLNQKSLNILIDNYFNESKMLIKELKLIYEAYYYIRLVILNSKINLYVKLIKKLSDLETSINYKKININFINQCIVRDLKCIYNVININHFIRETIIFSRKLQLIY